MTEENIKLFDSELKVMDVLWKDGDVPAKYVADPFLFSAPAFALV